MEQFDTKHLASPHGRQRGWQRHDLIGTRSSVGHMIWDTYSPYTPVQEVDVTPLQTRRGLSRAHFTQLARRHGWDSEVQGHWGASRLPSPGLSQPPWPAVLPTSPLLPRPPHGCSRRKRIGGSHFLPHHHPAPQLLSSQAGVRGKALREWGGESPWQPAPGTGPSRLSDPALTYALSPCQVSAPRSKKQFPHGSASAPCRAICISIIINYCHNGPSRAA